MPRPYISHACTNSNIALDVYARNSHALILLHLGAHALHTHALNTHAGWGMFALEEIEPEEFVIEYIGETIRATLADKREREYQAANMDDYMFRVDDE